MVDPPERMDSNSKTIYEILEAEILHLNIKPGQQLSETDVCKRFGVSRTPVRMAFQRLKDAGLLSIVPYKNTTASLLNFKQVEESIYMRIAVESMVIKDMIRLMDPLTEEKIRHMLRRQEILISGEFTPDEFYRNDSALHQIWFRFMDKEGLWKMIQRLQVNYTRFRMLDIVAVQNFQELYDEHVELFEIIRQKDVAAVEPFMRKHLNGGIKRLGGRIETEFYAYFSDEKFSQIEGR